MGFAFKAFSPMQPQLLVLLVAVPLALVVCVSPGALGANIFYLASNATVMTVQEPESGVATYWFTVQREGNLDQVALFQYNIYPGSLSVFSTDVNLGTYSTSFGVGVSSMVIPFKVFADATPEEDELVHILVCCGQAGWAVAAPNLLNVTIPSNGYPYGAFEIDFSALPSSLVFERPTNGLALSIPVSVRRSFGRLSAASVAYQISSTASVIGTDYLAPANSNSGVLSYAYNTSLTRTVALQLLPELPTAARVESQLTVELVAPVTGGALIGNPTAPNVTATKSVTITIPARNYPYGLVSFEPSSRSVSTSLDTNTGKYLLLDIVRICSALCGPFSVRVRSINGSAVSSSSGVDGDFFSVDTLVGFADSQTSAQLNVTLIDNGPQPLPLQFQLELSVETTNVRVAPACPSSFGGCATVVLQPHSRRLCPSSGPWPPVLQGQTASIYCTGENEIGNYTRECGPLVRTFGAVGTSSVPGVWESPDPSTCTTVSPTQFTLVALRRNATQSAALALASATQLAFLAADSSHSFSLSELLALVDLLETLVSSYMITSNQPGILAQIVDVISSLLNPQFSALFANASLASAPAYRLVRLIETLARGASNSLPCSEAISSSSTGFSIYSVRAPSSMMAMFNYSVSQSGGMSVDYPPEVSAAMGALYGSFSCLPMYAYGINSSAFYQTATADRVAASGVFATGLANASISLVNGEFVFNISHLLPLQDSQLALVQCGFWRPAAVYSESSMASSGSWETDGCRVVASHSRYTMCACKHLTNFAVILDYGRSASQSKALDILSYIGCAICLAGATLTFLVYALLSKLRAFPMKLLMNLCVTIIATQVLFVLSSELASSVSATGCGIIGGLLHYFLLAQLCMCLVQGINLWLVVEKNKFTEAFYLRYMAFAWGVPLLTVAGVLIAFGARDGNVSASYGDMYQDTTFCFMPSSTAQLYAFAVPAVCILIINMIFFGMIIHSIYATTHNRYIKNAPSKKSGKEFKLYCTIAIILGATWVFGVLVVASPSTIFLYLFVIANGLQGAGLFYFYVCTRPVLDGLKSYFSPYSRVHSTSGSSGSKHGSSATSSSAKKTESYQLSTYATSTASSSSHRHSSAASERDTFVSSTSHSMDDPSAHSVKQAQMPRPASTLSEPRVESAV